MFPKRRLTYGIAAGLAVFAVGATGCGSSSDDTDSSNSGASTAASTTSTTSASSFDLQAVKDRVEGYESGPQEYSGPEEAIDVKPGVNLAIVLCAGFIQGCVDGATPMVEIAKSMGWNVKTYDAKGTPKDSNNAVLAAVAGGADAIILISVDPHFIGAGLKAAHEKNIPIGSECQATAPSPDGFNYDTCYYNPLAGTMLGEFVVADSEGKADYLPFNDNSYVSAVDIIKAEVAAVEACPTCKVRDKEDFVGTDIAKSLPARVVDILRSDPDISYIGMPYDPAAAGVIPAIKNAGLADRVKVVSNNGQAQNLDFINKGQVQVADVAADFTYMGWMTVYQMARVVAGMEPWATPGIDDEKYRYGGNVPMKIATKESPVDGERYIASDLGYEEKFKALLGIK
jgi:ABC-type sugar transport system substrate-binding protein